MNNKIVAVGFAPDLVPLIKNGSKTLTYRVGDKYKFLKVGDKVPLMDSSTGEVFAEVEVTEKSQTNFGWLPIDRKGHEIYQSKIEQRETFEKYYGKVITDNEKMLILGFRVLKFFG